MIGTPEANDSASRMNADSIIRKSSYNLLRSVNVYARTRTQSMGLRVYIKFQKREANTNVKKNVYHL